jgi:hypothetical protein
MNRPFCKQQIQRLYDMRQFPHSEDGLKNLVDALHRWTLSEAHAEKVAGRHRHTPGRSLGEGGSNLYGPLPENHPVPVLFESAGFTRGVYRQAPGRAPLDSAIAIPFLRKEVLKMMPKTGTTEVIAFDSTSDVADSREAFRVILRAFEQLEKRVARLEKLAVGHNELLATSRVVLRGHQQVIEALASIAGVPVERFVAEQMVN